MSEESTREQAAHIFKKAAQYIRKYGWQVEGMGHDGAPRCSMGALDSAYPKVEWDKKLASIMYKTLYEELGGLSLTQFNSKYKSGEKVALLFEAVAARLTSKGRLCVEEICWQFTLPDLKDKATRNTPPSMRRKLKRHHFAPLYELVEKPSL